MVNGSLGFLCVVTKDGLDVVSQLMLNLQDAIQTSDELFLTHKELVQKITPIRISYLILVPTAQMYACSSHKKSHTFEFGGQTAIKPYNFSR